MTALEQAVVDAAIEVRLAETALWKHGPVWRSAKPQSYLTLEGNLIAAAQRLDDATDALMRERGV